MNLLFFIISFLASIIGAICGIGGGIIIKPALDVFHVLSVPTISFLSGATVLSMSFYSVISAKMAGDTQLNIKSSLPLAVGGAAGGIIGKVIFEIIAAQFGNRDKIGAVQAICLLVITIGTLLYTLNKNRIKTMQITNFAVCICIGLFLGILSSFLGIGGGPINLILLFYFFSMDTKVAAQNSLFIIFFSQAASILKSLITNDIPPFEPLLLLLMIFGGIGGAIIGRRMNKKIDNNLVNKLFTILMVNIIFICAYNIYQFL